MEVVIVSPVKDFISSLGEPVEERAARAITLLEKFGNRLTMPVSKSLGGGLFELRIRGRPEIRILYGFRQGTAIIVHGFIKKSRRIPKRELKTAKIRFEVFDQQ